MVAIRPLRNFVLSVLSLSAAAGLTPTGTSREQKPMALNWFASRRHRLPLTILGNNISPEDSSDENGRRKYSAARLGGRKQKKGPTPAKKDKREQNSIANNWSKFVLPLLLVVLLVQGLFSGDDSNDPSFVYYQSTVYESRTYGSDGRVDTSRRESFRSNIPSLIEERKLSSKDDSEYLQLAKPDEAFDREIDAMMKLQESYFDRFFR